MFIGRERELKALNKLYGSSKFEFAVIYGRRRIGKTELIKQFLGDKKAIYFMGIESNAKLNLENFSKSILEFNTPISKQLLSMYSSSQRMSALFWPLMSTPMLHGLLRVWRQPCSC